jgi:hypothetical protein
MSQNLQARRLEEAGGGGMGQAYSWLSTTIWFVENYISLAASIWSLDPNSNTRKKVYA